MNKFLQYAGVVALVLVLGVWFVNFTKPTPSPVLGSATGYNSLSLTPATSKGDTYGIAINGVTTEDMSGNLVGNLLQSATAFNFMGTVLTPNLIEGYGAPVSTSAINVAPTAAQICQGVVGTLTTITSSSAVTYTYPAATTTYATCGNGLNLDGTVNQSNYIRNTGAGAVSLASSTGDTILFASGTSNSLAQNQVWQVQGQFINSSTWNFYVQLFK